MRKWKRNQKIENIFYRRNLEIKMDREGFMKNPDFGIEKCNDKTDQPNKPNILNGGTRQK